MRIDSSENVFKDSKLYVRQKFKCRSEKCPNYGKIVQTVDIEQPVTIEGSAEP
jgi:hypothetical protein